MQSKVFDMNRNKELEETATQLFLKYSGLNREGEKHKKMREEAFLIKDAVKSKVGIKAVVSYFEQIHMLGRTLEVEGYTFESNAFELIDKDWVKGVFLYIITAGDYTLEDKPILEQVYADLWGNAYLDAGRDLLNASLLDLVRKEARFMKIAQGKSLKLSDSFGPGFYGMNVAQMQEFFQIQNGNEIDVELKNSSIMVPIKSCAGFYFLVNESYKEMKQKCADCLGNVTSCKLCKIGGNGYGSSK